jgi:hypothetical protein
VDALQIAFLKKELTAYEMACTGFVVGHFITGAYVGLHGTKSR